ncbi:isocitrate lyase/PEP mutase family protein [Actinomadura livida]|uniref:2-methylisocitrate lyase-like PEP mutase family enzyme n=1 Tax=Actinomadura livida TaxID=79909 RepID=A0A7W7IEF2_9ACTN|nr:MULTISPECIES: isocitrate lyase/phosphoenolpyruvate mutase family protein [Actinomadura]MBB4775584.1 2-methylisocitrate lyase-like PEP mutase family enzyme [Actinomadura catellatispora]GGT91390.1 phosphonomutase [Actinomadura livida]
MGFHELHHGDHPLVLPNAWDFASGAALVKAGFPAIGTTSLGVAAAAGKTDATGGTREETLALARVLSRLPVPVTVDIEGGFSTRAEDVAALVAELASLGIAGVNLEDGRADGTLAPVAHQTAVIAAVKEAAPAVFLNARTDTFWLGDPDRDETLLRARAFAEAGADGIFVPGIVDDADIRAVLDTANVPLNVLYLPGRTEYARMDRLGVHRVSTGSLLFRSALQATVNAALGVTGDDGGRPAPSYGDVQRLVRP